MSKRDKRKNDGPSWLEDELTLPTRRGEDGDGHWGNPDEPQNDLERVTRFGYRINGEEILPPIVRPSGDWGIVPSEDDKGRLHLGMCVGDAAGLDIPDDITQKDFDRLTEILFAMEGRIQLWIGDALNAMDRLKYGDITKIAEQFGRDPKTLSNWKLICRKVPKSLREEVLRAHPHNPLTIGHYNIVQAMPADEQRTWLMRAANEGLSIASVRRKIREARISQRNAQPEDDNSEWLFDKKRIPQIDTTIQELFSRARNGDEAARHKALAQAAELEEKMNRWLREFRKLLEE